MSFKLDKLTVRHLTGTAKRPRCMRLDLVSNRASSLRSSVPRAPARPPCCRPWPAPTSRPRAASVFGLDPVGAAAGGAPRPCARACSWRRRRRRCRRASAWSRPCWRRACRTGACGKALRSLFTPPTRMPPSRPWPLRPRRQTVCARRPPLGRRTPALQPGAPAALHGRRLPGRRADFRARPGAGAHHAGHPAARSRRPQRHPGVQPAPGRDGARAFPASSACARPHRVRPAARAASPTR
jgi:hypothetical protein